MDPSTSKMRKLDVPESHNYDHMLQQRWKARLEQVELNNRYNRNTYRVERNRESSFPIYNKRQERYPSPVSLQRLQHPNSDTLDFDYKSYCNVKK